jgi:nucleoside-diphosphate-sugar epimerase
MNFLIIGGSGFIGSSLCSRLDVIGNDFTILDLNLSAAYPKKSHLYDVRSTHFDLSSTGVFDVLVNLAAEHKDDIFPISRYYDVNVNGAINACRLADLNGISKIIFTSSVAVYGYAPVGTSESGALNPFNHYGISKVQAEDIYRSWQLMDPEKRSLVIIRPTVVFGRGNRGNVYNLLNQIAKNKFFMVGDGSNQKSLAYVENLAEFILFSSNFSSGIHLFNYADKPDFTMNELISFITPILSPSRRFNPKLPKLFALIFAYALDFISYLFNKKFPISAVRINKFCANSVYVSSVSTTCFKAPFELKDALRDMILFEFKK